MTKVTSLNDCIVQDDVLASFVHDTSLCTKNAPGYGICSGDIGSPLISKTKNKALIGIASWNYGCAGDKPDVYTAIYPHLTWIRNTLNFINVFHS